MHRRVAALAATVLVAAGLTAVSTAVASPPAAAQKRSDCWQTTDQFVSGLVEVSLARRWISTSEHVAELDAKPFGPQRAEYVRNVLVPLLFAQEYADRGRSDIQIIRDLMEGLQHTWPLKEHYAALTPMSGQPIARRVAEVLKVMDAPPARPSLVLERLCARAEAGPVPPVYVIPSDVDANGRLYSPYDPTDGSVNFRTEVVVFKKGDATVTGLTFSGDKPTLEAALTLSATTAAGRTDLAKLKVGSRIAAATTDGVESSVLLKVESVTGSGDSRTVAGLVIELPDLLRKGTLDLTDQINGAIDPALEAAATSTGRAQSPAEVGTFYDQDGNAISTADATPAAGPDGGTPAPTPAVWTSYPRTGEICLNAKNLSLKVASGSAAKSAVSPSAVQALDLVSTSTLVEGDRKTGTASTATVEGRGCLSMRAKDWKVTPNRVTGSVTRSGPVEFKISGKLSGRIAWEWKLLEKKFYVPVLVPALGIVIPSTIADGVTIPLKAEINGGTGLTWNYGRRYTGDSVTTTFDTRAKPMVRQTTTSGTWSDFGPQSAESRASIDGSLSIGVKPYSKFTFADVAGAAEAAAGPVQFPSWLRGDPWAQGLVSSFQEATTPELSGRFTSETRCQDGRQVTVNDLELTRATKVAVTFTLAQAAFHAWGATAPSARLGVAGASVGMPTLAVEGIASGACGGGDGSVVVTKRSDCWQTTDQFVEGLVEVSRARRWSGTAEQVARLDAKAYGLERREYVKKTLVPLLFGPEYAERGRSDIQIVRDLVEGLLHTWPKPEHYAALTPMYGKSDIAHKVAEVMKVIDAQPERLLTLEALCAASEASVVPPVYVIPSDVDPEGKISSPYDPADGSVSFRTEVVVFKKGDATVSGLSFSGTEPTLEAAFTLTATSPAGLTDLAKVKVGSRIAAATTDGVESSVLLKVESVTGSGESRTVSGLVIELLDLIRNGTLDLTQSFDAAIDPALEAAASDPDRAQSEEGVGTFYDEDGNPISTADATPEMAAASLTPAVWTSYPRAGEICLNAKNLSTKIAIGTAAKGVVGPGKLKALSLLSKGEIKKGDFKTAAGLTVKVEGRGCAGIRVNDWKITSKGASGSITVSSSVQFKISGRLSGELAWEWKLLEKKFYVPVPVPPLGIIVPSTLANGVSIPIKAEISGASGLTWNYGRQFTGQSVTASFATNGIYPSFHKTFTPGQWSDFGAQGASGAARVDGKVSLGLKPYTKFTFADVAGAMEAAAGPVQFPSWLRDNPWAQGLISASLEATVPELSGSFGWEEKCENGQKIPINSFKLSMATKAAVKLTVAEAVFTKKGVNAPSAQFGADQFTATLPTLTVFRGASSGTCSSSGGGGGGGSGGGGGGSGGGRTKVCWAGMIPVPCP